MKIREIKMKDLVPDLFHSLEGMNGEELVVDLKHTITDKGRIYGAFENGELIGFCAIERERFGTKKQYVELSYLQIASEKQGSGVGKQLFDTACSVAASFDAKKLYIAVESKDAEKFYQSLGCRKAEETRTMNSAEAEEACCMECDTGHEQTTGMAMGMCLGMLFGMVFGQLIFDNIGVGMCLGMAVGMCFGLSGGGFKGKNKNTKDENQ